MTRATPIPAPAPRAIVGVERVAEEHGGGRVLAGLLDALVGVEGLIGAVIDEDDAVTDRALERLIVTYALADGREITALRVERDADGLRFHVVLLTEEEP